jgi:hypothetical protein
MIQPVLMESKQWFYRLQSTLKLCMKQNGVILHIYVRYKELQLLRCTQSNFEMYTARHISGQFFLLLCLILNHFSSI